MNKKIFFASFLIGMVCFEDIFSTDMSSNITETENFYADAGISIDLTTQNKEQNSKLSDVSDSKESSDPEETGSVWSMSDLESVASRIPVSLLKKLPQQNPSEISGKDSASSSAEPPTSPHERAN